METNVMLDREVEELPEGWEWKKLSKIFKVKSGNFLSANMMSENGTFYVYGGNGIAGLHNDYNLDGENILIGRVGAKCGNVKLINGKIWVTDNALFISQYLIEVNTKYLEIVLSYLDLNKTANQAAQPVISFKSISDILVPLPPLPEQHRIVQKVDALFNRIDAAISLAGEAIVGIQMLLPAALNEVFNVEKYERAKLPEVCIFNPSKSEVKNLKNIEVSFVPMADLNENSMHFEPYQTKLIEEVYTGYTYFRENDVLLAKVTPCFENGKAGIAGGLRNGIGFGSSEYYVFRATKNVLPEWLYYNVSSSDFLNEGAKNMSGAVGLKRVTKDFINGWEIPLPTLSVQQSIITYLNNLSIKKSALESAFTQKLTQLKSLKRSLLDAAFRGKL